MTGLLLDLQPGTSPANGPMQWAVLAFGIVAILYIAVIRPMRKGKARPDPLERKPMPSSLAQQRAIERDMGNLLVQYEEMIRRMTAQVDIRAKKLEMLIQDAEERIARLQALSGTASPAAPPTKLAPSPISANPAQPGSTGSPQAASGTPPGQNNGKRPSDPLEVLVSPDTAPPQRPLVTHSVDGNGVTTSEAGTKAGESDAGAKADDRHAEIYRLADSGRTARQIAQELNRPDGEVELILHLRSPRPRQGDLWEQPAAAPAEPSPGQVEGFKTTESPPMGPADQRRKGRKKQRSPGA